ncbi:MAG TPA: cytochrome d ubiquinol oxidase subunit II [Ktedonobacteraceae bacterium]|jgi:cytochrome d ubiquinol oxidase subunit II
MSSAVLTLAVIWAGFIAYVALGGADFGAGAWDLLASGPTARRQHRFISRVLGPVWEANHVWLIFLLVGLMNLFPDAYATLMSSLFLPLMLALLGIVLRGAGFVFRTHSLSTEGRSARLWSRIFSISSVLTPCFLGISAAAVASGRVGPDQSQADLLSGWITPFSLAVGVMATLQCATLAAVYLTAEAHRQGERDFVLSYRLKALISSVLVSALGLLCLALSVNEAPWLWHGLLAHALAYLVATCALGLLVLVTLFLKHYRLASLFVVLETALLLTCWGVSQYPYLLPPRLTIEQAASTPAMATTMLVVMLAGLAVVLPALFYLFRVFRWAPGGPARATARERER